MVDIKLSTKDLWGGDLGCHIFLMKDGLAASGDKEHISKIKSDFYPELEEVLKKHQFSGKKGQICVLTASKNKGQLIQFIFVGLGDLSRSWYVELENLRRALATAVATMKKLAITQAALRLPSAKDFEIGKDELVKQVTVALHMADYDFTTFKSDAKPEWNGEIFIETDTKDAKKLEKIIEHANIIGHVTHIARHWADTPGNIMTPTALSEEARKIAKDHKLKCTIFGREKAEALGMGCFLAVDAGSDQDGKFVVMEYQAKAKNVPTIALVGKGITFDTGGITLKPEAGMSDMKYDMSGAAAVIAASKAIAQLKPNVNVLFVTPLVENMPSGKALKQDDIIKAMNGKTVEIKSTDAEGRLILADAICYTEKFYKPDVIIDIATLTGACSYALGHFYAAMLTRDDDLAKTLFELGQLSGDKVWRLPLEDDYKEANKSDFADIANAGSRTYLAGTITASCFLESFVSKARWVHLDIAGVACKIPGVNYLNKGATGAGVRLLVEFVMNFKK